MMSATGQGGGVQSSSRRRSVVAWAAVVAIVAAVAPATGTQATASSGAGAEPVPEPEPKSADLAALRALVVPGGGADTGAVDVPAGEGVVALASLAVTDAAGDVGLPGGDLLRVEAAAGAGTVTMRASTAGFADPSTAPDWVNGNSGILWYVDNDADGEFDFYAGLVSSAFGVGAIVLDAEYELACEATPSWNASTKTYTVQFPASCITNPGSFRFRVSMLFEDWPAGGETIDRAPDTGWSGSVRNDGVAPPPPSGGAVFTAVTPVRVFDTRTGAGGVQAGLRPAGSTLKVKVTGRHGVPSSGVGAVALNGTATGTVATGFVTVFPCGSRPDTSNVNFVVGETAPNAVIAPVSADGQVCFYVEAGTHLLADVSGWFRSGTAGFTSLTPKRVFDTRTGAGGVLAGLRPAGSTLKVKVAGRNGVPASGVGAVALNVTVTLPSAVGFVTVFPCGSRPNTSNVNHVAGQTVPNAVIAPVSGDGHVCFYTDAPTHLLADVSAWFSTASDTFRGMTPARAHDSRLGAQGTIVEMSGAPAAPEAVEPLITGGSGTTIEAVPWQVRLAIGPYLCGGSLVASNWVLTAAHCTEGFSASSISVHSGITYQSDMTTANAIRVRRVIEHPDYEYTVASPNDLALLELASPATGGEPIALYESSDGPARDTPGMVSGWGEMYHGSENSDRLRSASVVVRAGPGEDCGVGSEYIPSLMLCASGGVNSGVCRGDSGGPLAIQSGGRWRLAGVTSFGSVGCPNSPTDPAVFTRVSAFVGWIRSYVPGGGEPPPATGGKIGGPRVLQLQLTGRHGVPASGVSAVSLNLTVTQPEAAGFATVYPCGSIPDTSTINYAAGQTRAAAAIAPVSSTGKICVYSYARTHVIVDVNGWLPSP